MNKHEDIAKALEAHLSELTGRIAEIDSERRKLFLLIWKSEQLTSKIRTRSKASRILKFRKSNKLKRH